MSSLSELRQQLQRGWQQLRERASHAITRFNPLPRQDNVETPQDLAMQQGSRWGVLAADVKEKADEIIVRLEAPGMNADDFEISVVDDYLLVRGEKQLQREYAEGEMRVSECAYGRFERAIPLPVQVEQDKARAKYKRGVLNVILPKHHLHKRRRIEVSAS